MFNDGAGATEREREGERNTAPLSEGVAGEDIAPSEGTIDIPAGPREIPAETRTWAALGDTKAAHRSSAIIGWFFMD
jgi:hypothetical protein